MGLEIDEEKLVIVVAPKPKKRPWWWWVKSLRPALDWHVPMPTRTFDEPVQHQADDAFITRPGFYVKK